MPAVSRRVPTTHCSQLRRSRGRGRLLDRDGTLEAGVPAVDDRRDGHDQGGAEPYDASRAEPAAENLTTATPVSALRLLHRG